MKKTVVFGLLVILLAFGFIGCGGDNEGSNIQKSITLINIPSEYNEKYAVAGSTKPSSTNVIGNDIWGFDYDTSTKKRDSIQISNNNVVIKFWHNDSNYNLVKYTGGITGIGVDIHESNEMILGSNTSKCLVRIGFRNISSEDFIDGNITLNWDSNDFFHIPDVD